MSPNGARWFDILRTGIISACMIGQTKKLPRPRFFLLGGLRRARPVKPSRKECLYLSPLSKQKQKTFARTDVIQDKKHNKTKQKNKTKQISNEADEKKRTNTTFSRLERQKRTSGRGISVPVKKNESLVEINSRVLISHGFRKRVSPCLSTSLNVVVGVEICLFRAEGRLKQHGPFPAGEGRRPTKNHRKGQLFNAICLPSVHTIVDDKFETSNSNSSHFRVSPPPCLFVGLEENVLGCRLLFFV